MEIDYTAWQEFGLAGVVIGTLFSGVFFIMRWIFKFVGSMADKHAIEREDWKTFAEKQTGDHRDERNEWRNELREISKDNKAGIDKVCDLLNGSIHQLAMKDIGATDEE